jgi:Bacterial regulatory proteins, tetR family
MTAGWLGAHGTPPRQLRLQPFENEHEFVSDLIASVNAQNLSVAIDDEKGHALAVYRLLEGRPHRAAAIRRVGMQLIARHGFAAMDLRELAAEVGIQPGSLYDHIETKQALLFKLIREHLENLLASTEATLAKAAPASLAQLRAFTAHHVLYHRKNARKSMLRTSSCVPWKPAITPGSLPSAVPMRHGSSNYCRPERHLET